MYGDAIPGLKLTGLEAFALEPSLFFACIVFVLLSGLVTGSFAGALIYRIPRGLVWSSLRPSDRSARSRCTDCGAILRVADLIPLFSWLWLRGRCRYCKAPVSALYPVAEILCALAGLGVYLFWGLGAAGLILLCAMPLLVALAVIDYEHMILPDILTFLLCCLGFVFRAVALDAFSVWTLVQAAGEALLAGALIWALGAIMRLVLKKETLGFGDVKFFALAALWLGLPSMPVFMMVAGCVGVIWGAVRRIKAGDGYFPFGPALIIAFYGVLMSKSPALAGLLW